MSNTKTTNVNMLARIVGRFPKLILLSFVVLVAVLAWFTQNFKIDASADTLLLKNNKLYIQTQLMNSRFSPQEFILVAYQPRQQKLFSQQTFTDINKLTDAFSRMDRVEGVTSILNVPLLSFMDGLDTGVNADDWTWQAKKFSPEQMQDVFTQHPIYTDLLVNQQQSATAIQILFKPDPELTKIEDKITALQKKHLSDEFTEQDEQKVEALNQQADPIRTRLQKKREQEIDQIYQITDQVEPRADIYLGGGQVLAYQLIKIITNDLVIFGSAIALVICVMLLILFRQFRWVLIPVICCACSVVMTVGLFGMLDMRTTVISSNFIALQLILTLAVVIHLIVQFQQIARNNPDADQHELVAETINVKATPCFYAGLTTSVGFASLIFSNIQPVMAFGWMMIIAMMVSILVSLLLFPTLLNLMPYKKTRPSSEIVSKGMTKLADTVLAHKFMVFVLGGALLIGSVLGAMKLDVENSFINYFSESTKVRKELGFIDQQFGGSTPLDLIYTIEQQDNKTDLVMSAKTVQILQKIQHVLDQYPVVGKTMSVVNFTELAKKLNGGEPLTEYELTSVYHLLDKELTEQLLGAYFAPDKQQLRINSRIKDSTEGFNRAEFLQQLKQDIKGLGIEADTYQLTNLFVLYQDILQRLFESQINTLGIVYVALTLVLFAIFRSFKVALIAIVPNIISTMVILGLMGWLGISLDLMTITIAAIAMGIAVDDTIHFVHHYLNSDAQGASKEAVHKTFSSVGFAMLFTSMIITAGFGMLGFSDFIPSVMFGLLTGLAMLIALVTDLTLLPAMLDKFVGTQSGAKQTT